MWRKPICLRSTPHSSLLQCPANLCNRPDLNSKAWKVVFSQNLCKLKIFRCSLVCGALLQVFQALGHDHHHLVIIIIIIITWVMSSLNSLHWVMPSRRFRPGNFKFRKTSRLIWCVYYVDAISLNCGQLFILPAACLSLAVRTCLNVKISSSVFLSGYFFYESHHLNNYLLIRISTHEYYHLNILQATNLNSAFHSSLCLSCSSALSP